MSKTIKIERILCAAVWYDNDVEARDHDPCNLKTGYIVTGFRHPDCIYTHYRLTGEKTKSNHIQGFLTSANRFVDRKEAGQIAFGAGQIKDLTDCLVSEDLY